MLSPLLQPVVPRLEVHGITILTGTRNRIGVYLSVNNILPAFKRVLLENAAYGFVISPPNAEKIAGDREGF
jgi:hypothetical protein